MATGGFYTDKSDANFHSQGSSLAATHKPPSGGTSDLNHAPKAASPALVHNNTRHGKITTSTRVHMLLHSVVAFSTITTSVVSNVCICVGAFIE